MSSDTLQRKFAITDMPFYNHYTFMFKVLYSIGNIVATLTYGNRIKITNISTIIYFLNITDGHTQHNPFIYDFFVSI